MRTGLTLNVALTATMLWASVLGAGGSAGCSSAASSDGGASGHDANESSAGRDGGAGQGSGGAAGTVGAEACAAAPDQTDAGAVSDGGDEAGARDAGGAYAGAACAACELGSSDVSCDPTFLSATKDAQGNPSGWGVDTLDTVAEREAGEALLRCILTNHCSANANNDGPGPNPVLGCFCGLGVELGACLSGAGIHGACIAEYETAAAVTPTGPPGCSSIAAVANIVAIVSPNVKSPIGLADNVAWCAIAAPCSVCAAL